MKGIFGTLLVVCFVSLLQAPVVYADDDTLKVGEVFEGEVNEKKQYLQLGGIASFAIELQLSLKANQNIIFSSSVSGPNNRAVTVALQDPSGNIIAYQHGKKTVTLKVPEVSATGKHTVIVLSDQMGAFKIKATGPSNEELSIKALEEKIRKLKQELADAEAKLKSLKSGKK